MDERNSTTEDTKNIEAFVGNLWVSQDGSVFSESSVVKTLSLPGLRSLS